MEEDEDNLHKLRMLVDSLKKKYGEAIEKGYSLDTKCRELACENSALKQTQQALYQKFNETLVELQSLQKERETLQRDQSQASLKSSDAEKEIAALTEQHQELVSRVEFHEEEAKKATDELAAIKLKETQLERVIQFLRKRSEEAHLETNQMTQELASAQQRVSQHEEELSKNIQALNRLNGDFDALKEAAKVQTEEIERLKSELQGLRENCDTEIGHSKTLSQENERLKEELHDQATRYDSLFKEHTFFKTSMMRSVDEVKEDLAKAAAEHDGRLMEKEKAFYEKEKELLDELERLKATIYQFEAREGKIEEAEKLRDSLENERLTFSHDLDQLRSQNTQLTADKEEIEQRFKTAQQHLAKKVREAAIATEKIDTEKLKSIELQNQLNQALIKISELKNSLEMEAEHQKRSLLREHELLKNQETQNARLEEKYFLIHEKWKEAEAEVRELKKIEEKWKEAEKLFSKLGHFSPKAKPLSEAPPKAELPPKVEPVSNPIFEQISLFEEKKSPATRFKESLL
jgi:chromosome segregation ATPase